MTKATASKSRRALTQAGISYECVEAASTEEAVSACDERAFDCAFVDYKMPARDGLCGITVLHERLPFMSIIMATGKGDEEVAAEAMKLGASDYMPKRQIDACSIKRAIESALGKTALQRKVAQQREELENFASVLVHDPSDRSRRHAPRIIEIQLRAEIIDKNMIIDKNKIVDLFRSLSDAIRRMEGTLVDTLFEYTKAGCTGYVRAGGHAPNHGGRDVQPATGDPVARRARCA